MLTVNEIVTMEQLKKIKVKEPEKAGSRWRGIKHYDLLKAIEEDAAFRGWKLNPWKIALSEDGSDLAASATFKTNQKGHYDIEPPKGHKLAIGVQASNSQKRALSLVIGTETEGIGIAFMELEFRMRYNGCNDLVKELESGLTEFTRKARTIWREIKQLQQHPLTEYEADHLIMEAGRLNTPNSSLRRAIPWSGIGKIDANLRNRYEKEGPFSRNCWTLMVEYARQAAEVPPLRQMDAMLWFREILEAKSNPTYKKATKAG